MVLNWLVVMATLMGCVQCSSVSLMTEAEPIDYSSDSSDLGYDVGNATVGWTDSMLMFSSPCLQWTALNHFYFQLANVFLLLSYMAGGGINGLIYLRIMLALGSVFLSIWGWLVICAFDTFLWNAVFTVINAVHALYLLFTLRPVRFDKNVEEVYRNIFEPLKVSKQQFKKVVDCMKCIRPLKRGEHFAVEKRTKAETLSLLLSGRMIVIEKGKTLQVIAAMQFLDSPEWFGVGLSSDDIFQVSIQALEDSRVLLWHRDKLKLTLLTDAFLQAVFDHILGRDVVHKLVQMKEKIADPDRMRSDVNELYSNDEKSSLLSSPRKSVHPHGLVHAVEQSLLLDDTKIKKSPHLNSPNRYDYSVVERLDSTDI